MADGSKIEWTEATWNVITGCELESPGCSFCYAMKLAGTRLRNHPSRAGLTRDTKNGPVWTGEVRFNEQWLEQPLEWTRPRDIFVIAHGDLFYKGVPTPWIDRVFAVIALARRHRLQVLTKRPQRMLEYLSDPKTYQRILNAAQPLRAKRPELGSIPIDSPAAGAFWPHVLLGVSVEDQRRADERMAPMKTLADLGWRTWVSYEPALGPVDWSTWEFLAWLVSGGENGPRPTHPDWHRGARDWCSAHDIPYLFKQWGSWRSADESLNFEAAALSAAGQEYIHHSDGRTSIKVGKKRAGRRLDDVEHDGMPEVRR